MAKKSPANFGGCFLWVLFVYSVLFEEIRVCFRLGFLVVNHISGADNIGAVCICSRLLGALGFKGVRSFCLARFLAVFCGGVVYGAFAGKVYKPDKVGALSRGVVFVNVRADIYPFNCVASGRGCGVFGKSQEVKLRGKAGVGVSAVALHKVFKVFELGKRKAGAVDVYYSRFIPQSFQKAIAGRLLVQAYFVETVRKAGAVACSVSAGVCSGVGVAGSGCAGVFCGVLGAGGFFRVQCSCGAKVGQKLALAGCGVELVN